MAKYARAAAMHLILGLGLHAIRIDHVVIIA